MNDRALAFAWIQKQDSTYTRHEIQMMLAGLTPMPSHWESIRQHSENGEWWWEPVYGTDLMDRIDAVHRQRQDGASG